MDDQRVGKLADGSQSATALDEHSNSKVANESLRASVATREKAPDVNNDDTPHANSNNR